MLKFDLDDDWWGFRADGDASILQDNDASNFSGAIEAVHVSYGILSKAQFHGTAIVLL